MLVCFAQLFLMLYLFICNDCLLVMFNFSSLNSINTYTHSNKTYIYFYILVEKELLDLCICMGLQVHSFYSENRAFLSFHSIYRVKIRWILTARRWRKMEFNYGDWTDLAGGDFSYIKGILSNPSKKVTVGMHFGYVCHDKPCWL